MPRVNPDILKWAREAAGLTLPEAADKVGLGQARGVSGAERLEALEAGEGDPSRPLLLRMAKQYRQPLLTFYLARPPRVADRGQDFRMLPETDPEDEVLLDVLLRDMRVRQSLVRSGLEAEEMASPLDFVESASMTDGIETVLASIRRRLKLPLEEFRREANSDDAFNVLRSKVEEIGVFVVLAGDLGSHHSTIPVETFRGISLADPIAPFIVINDRDARSAWSFTLLHELVHVWLGQTGVSGGEAAAGIEQFCNDVASEFLVPAADLRGVRLPSGSMVERAEAITAYARRWNVSSSLVAYRLLRRGTITVTDWRNLARLFRDRWRQHQADQRTATRESTGGPSYYVVRRHRLGNALIETAGRLLSAGALTTTKAATILGVKPKQVGRLVLSAGARGA